MAEQSPTITAYLQPTCGWSNGVRAVLRKYRLDFTEKDVARFPEFRAEMEARTGQQSSPCVEVDGEMLADIGGEELERYLVAKGFAPPAAGSGQSSCGCCCGHGAAPDQPAAGTACEL